MGINGIAYGVSLPSFGKVDMSDLPKRMDTSIRTPGTFDRDAFPGKGSDRLFDCLLNGAAVLLALPSDERSTIIFNSELVARHCLAERAQRRVKAAQEFGRLDRLLAGTLQLDEPDGARAAGDS